MRIKKENIRIAVILIIGILFIVSLYYMIVPPVLTAHYLSKETRYAITINTSKERHYGRYNPDTYRYAFLVNGKKYEGETDKILEKGYHYFIKFYPPDPEYNRATDIIAVDDDAAGMPHNGYGKLPHGQIVKIPPHDNTWRMIVVLVIFIPSLAFVIFKYVQYDIITPRRLAKETRYAITSDVKPSFFNKKQYQKYSFSVGNRKYRRYTMAGLSGDNHYFIRFYPSNPRYNEPTFITATQQDIDNMPPDGYLILPHNEYLKHKICQ